MPSKGCKLTPAVWGQIVAAIHAGAYPHVAAEAFGVPRHVFEHWLEQGRKPKARATYASFVRDIEQARAVARAAAETAVYKKDPHVWLAHGPGRDVPGNPGWSSPVKAADQGLTERNALLDPQLLALFRSLMDVLAPFPEARAHAARALLDQPVDNPP